MRKVMIEKTIYNLEDLKQNKILYEKAQRKFAEGECEVDWYSDTIFHLKLEDQEWNTHCNF